MDSEDLKNFCAPYSSNFLKQLAIKFEACNIRVLCTFLDETGIFI